jgi:hypothetical protein
VAGVVIADAATALSSGRAMPTSMVVLREDDQVAVSEVLDAVNPRRQR